MGETIETILGKTKESKKFTLQQRAKLALKHIEWIGRREIRVATELRNIHVQMQELQHLINEADEVEFGVRDEESFASWLLAVILERDYVHLAQREANVIKVFIDDPGGEQRRYTVTVKKNETTRRKT